MHTLTRHHYMHVNKESSNLADMGVLKCEKESRVLTLQFDYVDLYGISAAVIETGYRMYTLLDLQLLATTSVYNKPGKRTVHGTRNENLQGENERETGLLCKEHILGRSIVLEKV